MRSVLRAALCFWLVSIGGAAAQTGPEAAASQRSGPAETGIVVELFTSQGCAACPPADEMLARLAQRPGVIALSLHVDIWDYLGWRDSFAKPGFTERQKAYARAEGSRSLFTPQMIVAGAHRVQRIRGMDLLDLLQAEAARPAPVQIEMAWSGAMLEVRLLADPPLERSVTVDLVRYRQKDSLRIGAGENAGRSVTYHNIVTLWDTLGQWDGNGSVTFHVRAPGAEPAVVIVQEPGPGPILAAARAP